MDTKEAVKKILKSEHMTKKELSEKMGYARATSLQSVLKNPSIKILIRMMNELDYEIVLKPKNGTDKAKRFIVLDYGGE